MNASLAQNCNVAIQELGNTSATYLEGEGDFQGTVDGVFEGKRKS